MPLALESREVTIKEVRKQSHVNKVIKNVCGSLTEYKLLYQDGAWQCLQFGTQGTTTTGNFWDDFFEIRGKDTGDDQLGDNGVNLENAIQACGGLTSWNFVYTPDDVTYQWLVLVGQLVS
ncbi:hypothetical protein GQ53DRAFT_769588 [Thozetella sp. PMI_491]|nr:hypothetical protein GQ53DRAFT_769588 [Thozetella sp. PMI_491]